MVFGIGIAAGLISLLWMALIPVRSIDAQDASAARAFRGLPACVSRSRIHRICGHGIARLLEPDVAARLRASAVHARRAHVAAGHHHEHHGRRQLGHLPDHSVMGPLRGLRRQRECNVLVDDRPCDLCVCVYCTDSGAAATSYALWAVFIVASVFNAAFNVAANRAMLGYVCSQRRVYIRTCGVSEPRWRLG